MLDASIIISFYNNTKALGLILKALQAQQNNFEVIIADDGSHDDAVNYIQNKIKTSPFPLQIVSQKDNGFRKCRILNKVISVSDSDYLIFIDGDCIPQTSFVEDHLANRQKGHILNGRRVDLPEALGEELYSQSHPESFFARNKFKLFSLYLSSKGKNIEKGFRIKNKVLSTYLNRKEKGIVGCNFSAFKSDLILVNGFDNTYEAAGVGEDTDIEFRMRGVGIKIINIFYQANILHLMHKELPRTQEVMDILEATKTTHQYIALNGLDQAYNEK